MSAAFSLDYSGDPVLCDFKGCILEAWHDGEHNFGPQAPKAIQWTYDRHCVVCGISFTILGANKDFPADTCGSEECLLDFAKRYGFEVPLICTCPQRDYPHDISVHEEIRSEWWKYKSAPFWPWSLMLSKREEPSTERKAA